jgi:nucleotide-binding universal stress UspA family protein
MKAAPATTRIALKNILFATDFSPAADAALPFAIQIAKNYGGKVWGVHVNVVDNYVATAPEAWGAMVEAAEKEAHEKTRLLNDQLQLVEHEVWIREGNVWDVLSNLIEQKGIDLIVLGTRGRTGFGKTLLGSVAEEILRQAPCPVLTVGPHVTVPAETSAKMHEILFATDLVADVPAAAPYAISLAQENQAHLALLHVIENPKTGDLVHPADVVEFKRRKLEMLVGPEAALWCAPVCLVEQGIPAEKILEAAKGYCADVIVVGARPARNLTTFLGTGTVHKVITQANCPVLTVRG